MRILKHSLVSFIILLFAVQGFSADADTLISQYFDKAVEELSGLTAAGVKPTKAWFEDQIFSPLEALLTRVQTERNLKDYSDPDDAVSAGFRVFVPSDTFTTTQTGNQNNDAISMENNTSLFGNGYSSVINAVKTTAAESMINCKIEVDSNIVISGINFIQDTTGAADYGLQYDAGIYITDASKNVIIYNCNFECIGDGITIGGADTLTTYPENIIIFGCTFKGDSIACNDAPCSRNGVSITVGSNIVVANCTFEGFHNVGAIDIEPNDYDDRVYNVVLANNTIKTRGSGITLSGGDWYNVDVVGNTIDCSNYNAASAKGIRVAGHLGYTQFAYRNALIADNVVSGCNTLSFGAIGIGGYNKGITVKNNSVFNNAGHGILVSPGSALITVEGNRCWNNGYDGIKFAATHNDCTSAAIDDANMLTDDADWIDIGTPTTNDTSSAYVLADSVSRKLVTDAADEGLGQVLEDLNIDSTEVTTYEASAWIFIETASTMTRQVNMTIGNATQVWEQENITGPNSEDGRGWTRLSCIFYPSGTDTLKITMTTGGGTFYVDSVKVYRRLGHMFASIRNNDVHDNNTADGTYHAMNLDGLMFSDVVNNKVSEYDVGDFDAVADTTDHYWGIVVQRTFFSRILNNSSYGSQYADLYINDIYNSDLSFIGIDTPFLLESSDFYNVSFPYARAMYFYEDSVAANLSPAPMKNSSVGTLRYPMPTKGRVVSIAAALSDSVTAGNAYFYPQIGFQVNGGISSDTDKYVTISGSTDTKVTNGRVPILTGDVFNFNAGDYVGVSMDTDAGFLKENSTATAVLLWE